MADKKKSSKTKRFNVRVSGQLEAKDQAAAYQALADHFLALAKGKEVTPLLPDGIERVTME